MRWIAASYFSAAAVTAHAASTYSVELTADQVGPTTADPDGEGTAEISVRSDQGQICYTLSVENIAPATAAHLHAAAAGRIGPIRLELEPPTDGSSRQCMQADRDLLRSLEQSPQLYYVDIHTSEYPGPALRGQLGE